MTRRITLVQGHPDAQARHFCHALADEYLKGAESRGHEVRCIDVAAMDFPVLRTNKILIMACHWMRKMQKLGESGN